MLSNIFFHKFLGFTWQLKKTGAEYTFLNLYIEESLSCIETACIEFFKSSTLLKYDAEACIKWHIHRKIKQK